jgi:peptide/nickel transport system substrate-binding protein
VTRALAATLFAALVLVPAAGTHGIKEGGTFRVATVVGIVTTIDPALPKLPVNLDLLDPACATLMAHPDKPRPAGYRLEPSLAKSDPVVSRNGRTYTFTIREDARFSDGKPVTARAFARALERILDPAMEGFVGDWLTIVGAQDVVDGKAPTARGVVARGRTLTLSFTKRPVGLDLMTGLCAVPPSLPSDPEGADAPLASPAPYYVSEYVPGERLVLERNRFYRGERPHHVTRFVANLAVDTGSAVDQVANGAFDTVLGVNAVAPRSEELAKRYGVNRSRFWVVPGFGIRVFHLNTSRRLFKNNPRLRQAVNFAVDRAAIAREAGFSGEIPTDQYLLPGSPGHRDERIYPLKGPDLKKARALADGHKRGGKAVLYTSDNPTDVSQAQILRKNLDAIGLELEIKFPADLFGKLATPGEPFDLGRVRWFGGDPGALAFWFDGRTIGQPDFGNLSYFNSPKINRLLDEASRLTGAARDRAYGELDVDISRDFAPMIPVSRVNAMAFVSDRVARSCVVMNPSFDLTAVCLK